RLDSSLAKRRRCLSSPKARRSGDRSSGISGTFVQGVGPGRHAGRHERWRHSNEPEAPLGKQRVELGKEQVAFVVRPKVRLDQKPPRSGERLATAFNRSSFRALYIEF